jgi:hypothetical protein
VKNGWWDPDIFAEFQKMLVRADNSQPAVHK